VAGRGPGNTFDTYHAVNGMDCGVWTVSAVIKSLDAEALTRSVHGDAAGDGRGSFGLIVGR
jgi:hypothetical protein